MQFHVSEYLADTVHLDAEEHGAYLMLLFRYWQTGKPLPNDDIQLARFARVAPDRWPTVRTTIEHLFNTCSTEWVHHRLEVELADAIERVEAKSRGGKASAAARKRNAIKARKSGAAGATSKSNTCSTPVEHMSNKEEVEEEVINNKKTLALSPPSEAPSRPATVIELPTNRFNTNNEVFLVTEDMLPDWQAAYPAVLIRQELTIIRSWLLDNPTKRKTLGGMRAFIGKWLKREQDRGGRPPIGGGSGGSAGEGRPRDKSLIAHLTDTSWAN